MLSHDEVQRLRATHSPQTFVYGKDLFSLEVCFEAGMFHIWDSRQTVGYLCSTPSVEVLRELLRMEQASPDSVRKLITGEGSPYNYSPREILDGILNTT